jgi:predicted TIM-barrel fold metal-dependent hydrolase
MISGRRVMDVHVHIQPWEMHPPAVQRAMESGRTDLAQIREFMESPTAFLKFLDACGIERAALINYVSPDVMGFTPEVNDWCARYAGSAPDRLVAFGSVTPRFTSDPAGETRRVLDLGIRALKIHPPHQLFAVNEYRTGGPGAGIGEVFRVAEERNVPVMIHTGTSVFPGARNVYADPMPADDVGVDFPKLRVILAHAGRPLHGEAARFLVRRHENFLLDLSGILPKRARSTTAASCGYRGPLSVGLGLAQPGRRRPPPQRRGIRRDRSAGVRALRDPLGQRRPSVLGDTPRFSRSGHSSSRAGCRRHTSARPDPRALAPPDRSLKRKNRSRSRGPSTPISTRRGITTRKKGSVPYFRTAPRSSETLCFASPNNIKVFGR